MFTSLALRVQYARLELHTEGLHVSCCTPTQCSWLLGMSLLAQQDSFMPNSSRHNSSLLARCGGCNYSELTVEHCFLQVVVTFAPDVAWPDHQAGVRLAIPGMADVCWDLQVCSYLIASL